MASNERVQVQLKVFKSFDCDPGTANDFFVAVVGPGIQLGNNDTKTAPRCNPVGRNVWGKDLWLPKNSTVQYNFLVVRACTGVVVDTESINPHKIYVGQKSIIIEHTYNKPAFHGREVVSEFKPATSDKGRYDNRKSYHRDNRRAHDHVQQTKKSTTSSQKQYNTSLQRSRQTTNTQKDDCKKTTKLNKNGNTKETVKEINKDINIQSNKEAEMTAVSKDKACLLKMFELKHTGVAYPQVENGQKIPEISTDMSIHIQSELHKTDICKEIMSSPKTKEIMMLRNEETKTQAKAESKITANITDMKVPPQNETDKTKVPEELIGLQKTKDSDQDDLPESQAHLKANIADMKVSSDEEADKKEFCADITPLCKESESNMSKIDVTLSVADVEKILIDDGSTDMNAGFQNKADIGNIHEETTYEPKAFECILSENNVTEQTIDTKTKDLTEQSTSSDKLKDSTKETLIVSVDKTDTDTVADQSVNANTVNAIDKMAEDIEAEIDQIQNIANAELDITDELKVEAEFDVKNESTFVKGDNFGQFFRSNGKKMAAATAGMVVLSCIGYFVFCRK